MEQAMLKLEKITKDYKVADTVVHALRGVSLNFRKTEFVSVLGHSGCGKTTLLNIIGGLDHYTTGDLYIRGVSTKDFKDGDWDAYRNHSIGFVFQSYNLIPHQTVLGNVELALTLSGVSLQERRSRAEQALERVGLGNEINKRPNQLSGGQMQRVAIARALVNNPEILLADEPTGALDTETSIQIMELIKEIAAERLVIMVTHNPELAKRYSTRIVELKDGEIISDTNPFCPKESAADGCAQTSQKEEPKCRRKDICKQKKKTSMSFWTAFMLSGRNLLTKKARTIVTSVAGSIGIISVCLVLALSSGFSNYIERTEEDMLSYYPLSITETAMDYNSILASIDSATEKPDPEKLGDKIYVNSFLTRVAQGMVKTNNITVEYIDYVESMPQDWYYAIQKGYGISLVENLYTGVVIQPGTEETAVNLSLSSLKEYYINLLSQQNEQYAQLAPLVDTMGNVVNKMPGTEDISKAGSFDYINSQYDLVKGRLPQSPNEALMVVGSGNDMTDLVLAQLGFIEQGEFLNLFTNAHESNIDISYDTLLNKQYTFLYNDAAYLSGDSEDGYPFTYNPTRGTSAEDLTATEQEGVNIDVVGVLRLKDGLNYGCLSVGLNLTEELINEIIAVNMQSKIVQWQKANSDPIKEGVYPNEQLKFKTPFVNVDEETGAIQPIKEDYAYLNTFIRSIGGNDMPNSLYIYAKDFDSKDEITNYLEAWNRTEEAKVDEEGNLIGNPIQYTDTVGLLMGIMQTMLDAITYVLVAFTGISLVVSTVMIGVITYVSVVERTKEIGILRAIGARKKDIKRVFNAETFIIGLCAGVLGVVVAYILQVVINLILTPLTGIAGLAALPVFGAVIMIVISVALTLLSGLVPASAAAKRDPVVALRTE